MPKTEIIPQRTDRFGEAEHPKAAAAFHAREFLEPEARLAANIIERWAMVAGCPSGEDSSGRQKIELLAPREVVSRACTIASLALEEFRARGWTQEIPSIDELEDAVKDKENGN